LLHDSLEKGESWDVWLEIISQRDRKLIASSERLPIQADDPAMIDALGRQPFARVLFNRISEVWGSGDPDASNLRGAFMTHIDGPWGSGKTSLLNLLGEELQRGNRATRRRWIVVNFNAWQNPRVRPPWWTLIKAIYKQCSEKFPPRQSLRLRLCWFGWRLRMDWVPTGNGFAPASNRLTLRSEMPLANRGDPSDTFFSTKYSKSQHEYHV
jgi:hypothetical protein